MKNEALTKVYASALLDLAQEKGELERVHEEVIWLAKVLDEDPTFRAFIESPKIEKQAKAEVLESSLRGKLADSLVNAIQILIRKGRQLSIRDVLTAFRRLHDERIGLVHVTATTAVPLSDSSLGTLVTALKGRLKKQVDLRNKVDPAILGGLIVRFDGMVADGSLQSALRKIGRDMKAVKFGSRFIHEN
jgi:F-type H+-transporting ATPase subunit delta